MTKIIDMTADQLAIEARRWDGLNEGGEGFNPARDEMARRARVAEAARPKSHQERMYALSRKLNAMDSSIARESGTYDANECETLRQHIANLQAEIDAEFMETWTLEVTRARRKANNDWVRANVGRDGKTHMPTYHAWLNAQGWSTNDLGRAIKLHGIQAERA